MWDLPRPGLEPVSPALAGRFSTTAPPGKPQSFFYTLKKSLLSSHFQAFVLGSGNKGMSKNRKVLTFVDLTIYGEGGTTNNYSMENVLKCIERD